VSARFLGVPGSHQLTVRMSAVVERGGTAAKSFASRLACGFLRRVSHFSDWVTLSRRTTILFGSDANCATSEILCPFLAWRVGRCRLDRGVRGGADRPSGWG
jgi:hypothetical protein